MAVRPLPVLVVSGHTYAAADLTLTALETGAIDCIQKPDAQPNEIDRFIADTAAGLHARRAEQPARPRLPSRLSSRRRFGSRHAGWRRALHMPGRSTPRPSSASAPPPAACPPCARWSRACGTPVLPIVVVQHMPPTFTGRLAARLAQTTGLPSAEARDGERLTPGTVWVAPGRLASAHRPQGGPLRGGDLSDEDPGLRPQALHRRAVPLRRASRPARTPSAVILTGMGRDGADGLLAMRRGRRAHHRPGRGHLRRLRHAQGGRRRSAPSTRSCRSTASPTASCLPRPRRALATAPRAVRPA